MGALLGEMAAGTRLGIGTGEPASYAQFSANPDAAAPPNGGASPCLDCADSYGVALRMRAHRDDRTRDDAFRELGAVDVDPPILTDVTGDYRYGGRFPEPEPATAVASEDPNAGNPRRATLPVGTTATPAPAQY